MAKYRFELKDVRVLNLSNGVQLFVTGGIVETEDNYVAGLIRTEYPAKVVKETRDGNAEEVATPISGEDSQEGYSQVGDEWEEEPADDKAPVKVEAKKAGKKA